MPSGAHNQAARDAPSDAPPTKRDLTSWWKQFKNNNSRKKEEDRAPPPPENPGIFGVPLGTSIQYAHVAISLFDENGKSFTYGYVPIVVAKCGVFLKEKATEIEGIFRLAGAERRIKELQIIFNSPDRYGKGLDWNGYTVHDASNILRRYLNQLPEPIVPFNFYHQFRNPLKGHQAEAVGESDLQEPSLGNFDIEATIKTYQRLITELPALNRQLLLYILDLLAVFASKSDINRMTASNLSAIFQPGLLGLREHDMMPKEYRLSQDVLIFLIENQDSFLVGMQGTAADEKTIQEVQAGAAAHRATASAGSSKRNAGVGRTASNASAGAESIRKYGNIRRNVSTSSRRSRQSGHTPSPVTPPESPFSAGGKGGVHRSNPVPSKKSQSPSIGSGPSKLHRETVQGPVVPQRLSSVDAPAAAQTSAEREQAKGRLSPHLRPVDKRGSSRDRGMRMEMPPPTFPSSSPGGTPSKERPFSGMFKQSPTAPPDFKDGRRPNKLQKKRPEPGTLGAKTSNASLGGSHPPSPGHGSFPRGQTAQTDAQRLEATAQMLEQVNENHEVVPVPPKEQPPRSEVTKESQMTNVDPVESSQPEASHALMTPGDMPQPSNNAAIQSPAPAKSPATSVHSRVAANDVVSAPEPAPREPRSQTPQTQHNGGEATERSDSTQREEKKEKKHSRWRLSTSARKETRESKQDQHATAPASHIGSTSGAELSTSSVGSFGLPRKSLTDDSQFSGQQTSTEENDSGSHAEKKGPIGWFKGKLQERKEREEAKERAKSPPPSSYRSDSESKPSFASGPMPTVSESVEPAAGGLAEQQTVLEKSARQL